MLFAIAFATVLATTAHARPSSRPASSPRPPILGARVLDDIQRSDINNISMVVKNTGSFSYDTQTGSAGLEFPKGSGKTAVFAAGLWMGALVNGKVRVSVSEYSDDFRPGSVIGSGAGATPDDAANAAYKVYKLLRSYPSAAERDAELANYNAGAVPHGAPVVTVQGDGTLNIRGDQMLWCVFNDLGKTGASHNGASSALPLGVEVQLTAFAFTDPAGPADRTVFLQYKILNKGANVLSGLHTGMWVDPDLGGFADDLVGGDPTRGMGYVYNATGVDEQYGGAPPAVGFDWLAGPGGLGMTAFVHYPNGAGPVDSVETYNNLQGLQTSGAPIIDPTTGLPTKFEVTGDPVAGTGWLDTNPSDKRMLLGSGPTTLSPGQSLDATCAVVIGQGSNRLSSVLKLQCDDEAMQAIFDSAFLPPLPPEPECGQVVNCPRYAPYWYDQFNAEGPDYTPAQLTEIAQRVDAASLYLEWSANPVQSLRTALSPAAGSTPLARAIRQYAAFLCNVSVTSPVIAPVYGPPVFLDGGTPISCPGLEATNVDELARTATLGLSDASYIDAGANPQALGGVNANSSLPFFNGGAGYAADVFGSTIPSGSNTHTVEIRFTGGPTGQYAYRYLRTFSGGFRVYLIQDYVPVPFVVWDVDANVQLNAAFLENDGPPPAPNLNGAWDPDDSPDGGREILWIMDSAYSGDATPDSKYFNDPALQDVLAGNLDHRYIMWSRRTTPGAVIDGVDLFRFTYGGVVPGPSVDVKLLQLAALDPGDPSVPVSYDNIASCLGDINNGIGIGPTCDHSTAALLSLVGADATTERVTLTWYSGGTPPTRVQVERRENAGAWATLADVTPDGRGMIVFEDTHVVPGTGYDYRLRVSEGSSLRWMGQASVVVPLGAALSLGGFHPNPSGPRIQLAFTLVSRAPATLSVFDVSGRRIYSREVGSLGPGAHLLPLERAQSLPSGVYMLHLEQDGHAITKRAVAIR
jgi:hypothetical protein